MSYRCEYHSPTAVIVGPSSNGFWAEILKRQAIDILSFEQNVLTLLIIVNVMLLVIHHKILNALRDRMLMVDHAHFERPQRRVSDISPTHHIAIRLGRQRNMAVVMQRVKAVSARDEFFQSLGLI